MIKQNKYFQELRNMTYAQVKQNVLVYIYSV